MLRLNFPERLQNRQYNIALIREVSCTHLSGKYFLAISEKTHYGERIALFYMSKAGMQKSVESLSWNVKLLHDRGKLQGSMTMDLPEKQ